MSIKQFISKHNVTMVWEIINDEDCFRFLSREIQEKIYNVFLNNIQGFFETEKIKTNNLVEINKKYILLIINYIRSNYSYQLNKIKIHNEPVKELITYEEIQNDRKSQMEKDYTRRQNEFEDTMTIKVPPVPEFADRESDRPIKEMDTILKEMQRQRNYEIEEINKGYNNTPEPVDNWLKSQETKINKIIPKSNINENIQEVNSKFKYFNTENETSNLDKKNVSFSNIDEINTINNYDEEDNNIFIKLKKNPDTHIYNENEKVKIEEIEKQINNDRISKLELEIQDINKKIDKILELLTR